jgi:hypothetical protein
VVSSRRTSISNLLINHIMLSRSNSNLKLVIMYSSNSNSSNKQRRQIQVPNRALLPPYHLARPTLLVLPRPTPHNINLLAALMVMLVVAVCMRLVNTVTVVVSLILVED